jgi:hypothetical protein
MCLSAGISTVRRVAFARGTLTSTPGKRPGFMWIGFQTTVSAFGLGIPKSVPCARPVIKALRTSLPKSRRRSGFCRRCVALGNMSRGPFSSGCARNSVNKIGARHGGPKREWYFLRNSVCEPEGNTVLKGKPVPRRLKADACCGVDGTAEQLAEKSREPRKNIPQRLKPDRFAALTAQLKLCPFKASSRLDKRL